MSAGVQAVRGHPIHPEAGAVLEQLGAASDNFVARQLNKTIATESDLIVTMTRTHRDHVLSIAPRCLHKTFLLTEIAASVNEYGVSNLIQLRDMRPQLPTSALTDVVDPIGQNVDVFAQVGLQISRLVPAVIKVSTASTTER